MVSVLRITLLATIIESFVAFTIFFIFKFSFPLYTNSIKFLIELRSKSLFTIISLKTGTHFLKKKNSYYEP